MTAQLPTLPGALDLDPQYGPAYRERALANQTRGHDDQTIADYARAIEFFPRDELMYHFRGRAYVNRATERGLSESYLENGPDKADIARAIKADLDQAISDYDRALALGPKDDDTINEDRERETPRQIKNIPAKGKCAYSRYAQRRVFSYCCPWAHRRPWRRTTRRGRTFSVQRFRWVGRLSSGTPATTGCSKKIY